MVVSSWYLAGRSAPNSGPISPLTAVWQKHVSEETSGITRRVTKSLTWPLSIPPSRLGFYDADWDTIRAWKVAGHGVVHDVLLAVIHLFFVLLSLAILLFDFGLIRHVSSRRPLTPLTQDGRGTSLAPLLVGAIGLAKVVEAIRAAQDIPQLV